jgi:hypothetical protein
MVTDLDRKERSQEMVEMGLVIQEGALVLLLCNKILGFLSKPTQIYCLPAFIGQKS